MANIKPAPQIISRKKSDSFRLIQELGNTGTEHFSGYYSEEFNPKWRDNQRVELVEEMRRGDAAVKAILNALKTPILAANFRIDGPDDEQRKFVEENLLKNPAFSWREKLKEILTELDFGHSVFEKLYRIREDGMIGLKNLAPRIQHSILKWELQDGSPGIIQYVRNDEQGPFGYHEVGIPLDKLVIFTNEKEGGDVTGQSILRSAYKHWYIKDKTYRIVSIAIERTFAGIPMGTLPEGAGQSEKDEMENLLKNLKINELQYLILPSENWKVEFLTVNSNAMGETVDKVINHHNRMILMSVLAQFLDLGSGDTGSFALSKDQSSFFLKNVEQHLFAICDIINKYVIRDLIDRNFNGVKEYPELCFSELGTVDFKEMSEVIKALGDGGFINPQDEKIQDFINDTFNLPKIEADETPEKKEIPKEKESKKDYDRQEFNALAEKKKPLFFRPLNDFEKGVDLEFLNEKTDLLQAQLEADLAEQLKGDIDMASRIVEKFIKTENLNGVLEMSIVNKDKLAKIIRGKNAEAFDIGKKTASEELEVSKPKTPLKFIQVMKFDAAQQADTIREAVEKSFKENVKNGIQAGVAIEAVAASATNTAREEAAKKIMQTSTSTIGDYIGKGRLSVFNQNITDISGFIRTEVLDSKTCEICMSLDGRIIKADDPFKNLTKVHNNCRGEWIPIKTSIFDKVIIDPAKGGKTTPEELLKKGTLDIPPSVRNKFETVGGVPQMNKFKQLKKPINKGNADVQRVWKEREA